MMNKSFCFFLLFISSINIFAFTKGSGSEFLFKTNGQNLPLSIYFTEVSNNNLGVEFHFAGGSIFMQNMWQQYRLYRSTGKIKITEGYIKTGKTKPVEKMTTDHFNINKGHGVELSQFLFSDQASIGKKFVGDETVEVPAGSFIAKHYRENKNGQVVDFWIADSVKPIGLIKLVSKNATRPSHNYSIELSYLLENVAAAINPKKSSAMSKETKQLMQKASGK